MQTQNEVSDSGGTPVVLATGVLGDMAREVKACNERNGWYESDRSFGDDVALLHSEVSEAFEAFRTHRFEDATEVLEHVEYLDHEHSGTPLRKPKPEGVGSELADVLVRLLDTCDRAGVDLFAEFRRKMDYNWTREYRHGGKAV